jgi:hypothetical protein
MATNTKLNLTAFSYAFIEVFSSGPYFDKWYSDEQVLTIVNGSYDLSTIVPDGSDTVKSLRILNGAVTKSPILLGIDGKNGNEGGFFRMKFTINNAENKRRERHFYLLSSDKSVAPFPLNLKGAQTVYDRKVRKSTRKRVRRDEPELDNINDDDDCSITRTSSLTPANEASLQPTSQFRFTFWESTEARQLFTPLEGEKTILAVHRMIQACQEHSEKTSDDYGQYSIKYLILRRAYLYALEKMNGTTWRECCSLALTVFSNSGFKTIKNSQTIMKWNRHFRAYNTIMPIRSKQTKDFEPKLFSVYPEAKAAVNIFFSKNLENVNVDQFRSFLLDVALPKIALDANDNNALVEPLEIGELLTSINLKTLGLATAYKYLR